MLSEKEQRCLKETRLRNLKRKYSKIKEHPDLLKESNEIQKEITTLENELN